MEILKIPHAGDAIKILYSETIHTASGDGVYTWLDGHETTVEERAAIDAKVIELQAEYEANQYQRDRIYPTWQEQMDMQYHDSVNSTTTWKDAVAKVKADNPKP